MTQQHSRSSEDLCYKQKDRSSGYKSSYSRKSAQRDSSRKDRSQHSSSQKKAETIDYMRYKQILSEFKTTFDPLLCNLQLVSSVESEDLRQQQFLSSTLQNPKLQPMQ